MEPLIQTLFDLSEDDFVNRLGGVYEHSPWAAQLFWQAWHKNPAALHIEDAVSFADAMAKVVDGVSEKQQRALLRAHPDLAGKLALAGELTEDSTNEQSQAGLDACTEDELKQFQYLNHAYKEKFGFPFIMAVKGAKKEQVLQHFVYRLENDEQQEFLMALQQVHKIALFRLQEKLRC